MLGGIAKKLLMGQRITVDWRYRNTEKENVEQERSVWHGEVVSTSPLRIKYDEDKRDLYTLPPIHDIFIQKIHTKVERNTLFRLTAMHAQVGGYVHVRFSNGDNVVARVIWKHRCVCGILSFRDNKRYMFPPPPRKAQYVKKIWFTPACPRAIETDHRSTVTRFERAAVQHQNHSGSESPADNGLLRHVSRKVKTLQTGKIKVCTINVRTLTDPPRLHAICAFALLHKIDIVVITETRRTSAQPDLNPLGGWGYVNEPADDHGNGGVGVLISPRMYKEMRSTTTLMKHRIVAVKFKNFAITAVYMPTAQNPDQQEIAYSILAGHCSETNGKHTILGDLNARPMNQANTTILQNASHRLDDLLVQTRMKAANVGFPGIGTPPTHKRVTLDYVITKPSMVEAVRTYTPPVDTDHRALVVTLARKFAIAPKRPTAQKRQGPPDLRSLQDPDIASAFASTSMQLPCTALVSAGRPGWLDVLSGTAPVTYDNFCIAAKIAKETLPRMKNVKRRTHWQNPMIADMIRLNDATGAVPHATLISAIDSLDCQEHTSLLRKFADCMKQNPRLAWKCLGATLPSTRAQLPADSPHERNESFFGHFRKLFASDDQPPDIANLPAPTRKDTVWRTGEFTDDEIRTALAAVQAGKSAGIDDISNEILKVPQLFETVAGILRTMQSEVTQQQRTSALVPLPKKGDLSVLGNWRGISLMPHITKLFDKLLLHRIRDAIDPFLNPAQNGFRKARGTVHHVAAAIATIEMVKTTKSPLHGCFVDFSKAFDSVKWKVIAEEFRYWGAPDDFVGMAFSVMVGHVIRVRTDDLLSEEIPVGVGVLQGDTLAPYIFVMVMDKILRALKPDLGIKTTKQLEPTKRQTETKYFKAAPRIPALGFADDVLLLTTSSDGMQQQLGIFETTALTVGLKLNMGKGKTERFVINDEPGSVKISSGEEVPVVSDYKYLGVNILDYETDLRRRKRIAWAAIVKYKGTWKSQAPWETKRMLFNALVEPLLSYGLVAWPMTEARLRQLDGLHARLLRAALGLPPAFLSRGYASTERIYGNLPFFSEQLAKRRVTFFAHTAREHSRGTTHYCIDAILHLRGSDKEFYGGGVRTLQRQLMLDYEVSTPEELKLWMEDRDETRAVALKAAQTARKKKIAEILRRRPPGYAYPTAEPKRRPRPHQRPPQSRPSPQPPQLPAPPTIARTNVIPVQRPQPLQSYEDMTQSDRWLMDL